jgi:hypothetical protein
MKPIDLKGREEGVGGEENVIGGDESILWDCMVMAQ